MDDLGKGTVVYSWRWYVASCVLMHPDRVIFVKAVAEGDGREVDLMAVSGHVSNLDISKLTILPLVKVSVPLLLLVMPPKVTSAPAGVLPK